MTKCSIAKLIDQLDEMLYHMSCLNLELAKDSHRLTDSYRALYNGLSELGCELDTAI